MSTIRERVELLSDESLLGILREHSEEYEKEALAIASHILDVRGISYACGDLSNVVVVRDDVQISSQMQTPSRILYSLIALPHIAIVTKYVVMLVEITLALGKRSITGRGNSSDFSSGFPVFVFIFSIFVLFVDTAILIGLYHKKIWSWWLSTGLIMSLLYMSLFSTARDLYSELRFGYDSSITFISSNIQAGAYLTIILFIILCISFQKTIVTLFGVTSKNILRKALLLGLALVALVFIPVSIVNIF